MKALVFGSLNIDRVYSLEELPEKGVTLRCTDFEIHVGGKGLNQAIALKKAGFETSIAGALGEDGAFLEKHLRLFNVNTEQLMHCEGFTGHAVIEVDKNGQNQMILFPGANYKITEEYCDCVLETYGKDDIILMQYETSCVEYMIKKAKEKGLTVVLNPSPYVKQLQNLPYEKIDILILNEEEGQKISGKEQTADVISELLKKTDNAKIVLTLGGKGAVYADGEIYIHVPAFRVDAVDTTGAGDTFTGYFLQKLFSGHSPLDCLKFASAASALAVTKKGAAETIPTPEDVKAFLKERNIHIADKNEPHAVFLDLDGTLMGTSFTMSDRNRETIDALRAKGHYVFANTGRASGNIPHEFAEAINHLDGIIAGSGSFIKLKDRVLLDNCFDKNTVKDVAAFILGQSELWAVFECRDKIIGINSTPKDWHVIKTITSPEDFDGIYSDAKVEVIAVGKKPTKEFFDKFNKKMRIIPLENFADCLCFECSKSAGMKTVLKELNIPIENSIAMGDSNNDLDMLNAAGISVAMKNASENVLKTADIITATNTDDGVAAALEKLLLN